MIFSVYISENTQLVQALDKPWVIDRGEFKPIMNYKKYIAMLEAQGDHPPELLEKMRKEHENYYATHCQVPDAITNLAPRLPGLENTESEINGCQAFIEFNKVKDPQDTIPMCAPGKYQVYGKENTPLEMWYCREEQEPGRDPLQILRQTPGAQEEEVPTVKIYAQDNELH